MTFPAGRIKAKVVSNRNCIGLVHFAMDGLSITSFSDWFRKNLRSSPDQSGNSKITYFSSQRSDVVHTQFDQFQPMHAQETWVITSVS